MALGGADPADCEGKENGIGQHYYGDGQPKGKQVGVLVPDPTHTLTAVGEGDGVDTIAHVHHHTDQNDEEGTAECHGALERVDAAFQAQPTDL